MAAGTGEAILAAILADPADDLPRLAYADWLEETGGDLERAEFIRLQVASAARGLSPGERRLEMALRVMWGDRWAGLRGRPRRGEIGVFYDRGFVESAQCSLAAWLGHGPALVRAHPVERVALTDRKPWRPLNEAAHVWFASSVLPMAEESELPPDLFRIAAADPRASEVSPHRAAFDSEGDACDALSGACPAWARAHSPAGAGPRT